MDDASYHIESIEEKELPIDPINAYNHMVIYLRWCMEHDLMGEDFLKEYSEVAKQVKADPYQTLQAGFLKIPADFSIHPYHRLYSKNFVQLEHTLPCLLYTSRCV